MAYAKAQGKLISCDPNLRLPLWPDADAAKEQMLWSLRQADVVKISDNEVEFLWNCTPEEGADKLLTEFGVSLAMVTLGPDGCLLKTRTAAFRAACPKVHPVDTIQDSFRYIRRAPGSGRFGHDSGAAVSEQC